MANYDKVKVITDDNEQREMVNEDLELQKIALNTPMECPLCGLKPLDQTDLRELVCKNNHYWYYNPQKDKVIIEID